MAYGAAYDIKPAPNIYTVVATCVANEVDPLAYLTDVLTRLDSTPADQVDTLLPQNWAVPAP